MTTKRDKDERAPVAKNLASSPMEFKTEYLPRVGSTLAPDAPDPDADGGSAAAMGPAFT